MKKQILILATLILAGCSFPAFAMEKSNSNIELDVVKNNSSATSSTLNEMPTQDEEEFLIKQKFEEVLKKRKEEEFLIKQKLEQVLKKRKEEELLIKQKFEQVLKKRKEEELLINQKFEQVLKKRKVEEFLIKQKLEEMLKKKQEENSSNNEEASLDELYKIPDNFNGKQEKNSEEILNKLYILEENLKNIENKILKLEKKVQIFLNTKKNSKRKKELKHEISKISKNIDDLNKTWKAILDEYMDIANSEKLKNCSKSTESLLKFHDVIYTKSENLFKLMKSYFDKVEALNEKIK